MALEQEEESSPSQPAVEEIVPLKIGDAVVHLPVSGTAEEIERVSVAVPDDTIDLSVFESGSERMSDIDLSLIEKRCRLKARSCRLFIEQRAVTLGSEAERDMLDRVYKMVGVAKAMQYCLLWVFVPDHEQPDSKTLSLIAECYDAQADAVALIQRLSRLAGGVSSEQFDRSLHLLAEACSALRVVLGYTWLNKDDQDQAEAHVWLRRVTDTHRVFIRRYMAADDPADPKDVAELRARIKAEANRLRKREEAEKKINNGFGKVRYHAGLLIKCHPEDAPAHWVKISEAVEDLEAMGVPTTDLRITEAIAPAAATWSHQMDGGDRMADVVARAVAFTNAAVNTRDPSGTKSREWSDGVLEVRELLRGRRMVIIGGEPNVDSKKRIELAFELEEAEWLQLTEHGTGAPMQAPISRPETSIVLIIVKLVGHLHAEQARQYARDAGKPCVMLSGGYNPERIASDILQQASAQLCT